MISAMSLLKYLESDKRGGINAYHLPGRSWLEFV